METKRDLLEPISDYSHELGYYLGSLEKSRACGIVAAAFIKGEEVATMVVDGGMMKVFQVTILAAMTRTGWHRVSPLVKYTAIFEKLEEVFFLKD